MLSDMAKKYLFFILLFIFLFIVVYIIFYNILLVDVSRLKYDFMVSEHIGFNADTDYLHFGTVFSGSFAQRSFWLLKAILRAFSFFPWEMWV